MKNEFGSGGMTARRWALAGLVLVGGCAPSSSVVVNDAAIEDASVTVTITLAPPRATTVAEPVIEPGAVTVALPVAVTATTLTSTLTSILTAAIDSSSSSSSVDESPSTLTVATATIASPTPQPDAESKSESEAEPSPPSPQSESESESDARLSPSSSPSLIEESSPASTDSLTADASSPSAQSPPTPSQEKIAVAAPPQPPKSKYYLDDGPPGGILERDKIEWVTARAEPISRARNSPYTALGKRYTPYKELIAYKKRGMASWYGRRYHGRATASGEIYNMYKMTAAHPILPIPSYARVTRVGGDVSVTVRINDRGPFLSDRIIDLSYAAAAVLGYAEAGTAEVIVETIIPDGYTAAAASEATAEAGAGDKPRIVAQPADAVVSAGNIYIQVGAFRRRAGAETTLLQVRDSLPAEHHSKIIINTLSNGLYAVHIGPYPNRPAAAADDQTFCRQHNWCGYLTTY